MVSALPKRRGVFQVSNQTTGNSGRKCHWIIKYLISKKTLTLQIISSFYKKKDFLSIIHGKPLEICHGTFINSISDLNKFFMVFDG